MFGWRADVGSQPCGPEVFQAWKTMLFLKQQPGEARMQDGKGPEFQLVTDPLSQSRGDWGWGECHEGSEVLCRLCEIIGCYWRQRYQSRVQSDGRYYSEKCAQFMSGDGARDDEGTEWMQFYSHMLVHMHMYTYTHVHTHTHTHTCTQNSHVVNTAGKNLSYSLAWVHAFSQK
jgi:hypothetical protein